jgi:hypothetical protein
MYAAPNYTNSPKIAPGRMSCSLAHTSMEISVSIPAFWAYVNKYLSRAGAVDLTMMLSWGTSHLHHGSEDEDTSMNESAVALTTTCFHRSRATHIAFQDLRNYEHEALLRVMTKPAPRLASMHILQESDHIDFPFYQSFHALVELSNNPHECNAAYRALLPQLSRLRLFKAGADAHLSSLLGFLKHTPSLTELLLEYTYIDYVLLQTRHYSRTGRA